MADISSALVIDDDSLVCGAISRQLSQLGVPRVDTAADGAAARRALGGGQRYPLIVLDLLMPGTDAVELLRDTARLHPGSALILVSSLDERILRTVAVLSSERGLRVLGALRKPLRLEALDALLQKLAPAAAAAPAPARPQPTASDLTLALQRREITALVQPKLRSGDGSLHSVELLARWQDSRLGAVDPRVLAQLADSSGQSEAFTMHMLGIGLRNCADWWASDLQVPVSVNLGGEALRCLGLPDLAQRLLNSAGLQPAMLILEIPESGLLDDPLTLDVLARLRMQGIRVSLDNFGAGHGSLVRLQRLPVTEVKVARSFVRCLPGAGPASAIVEHSIRLARALELETVAVGIENEAQAQQLRQFGCEVLQGSHIGAPMPPQDLPDWLRSRAAMEQAA